MIMKKIQKYLMVLILSFMAINVFACDACKKEQPKFLQGITHGRGPDSQWDYLIVTVMVIITLYVLVATIKHLVKPLERNGDHIKRMILNDTNS
jgi:hypothetical protein